VTLEIEGRARKFGDDINTDYIISSARKKETLSPDLLKAFLFETLDPGLAASVEPGDVIVAGTNFGCGSAMEVGVTVPLAAGITVVLAKSFARTYYRNAINNGLIPVECDTTSIDDLEPLTIVVDAGAIRVERPEGGAGLQGRPVSDVVLDILSAGGLVPYMRAHGGFPSRP
jgi:3-isopropylmalate/(R)-2-methylmalate dehydratase small subunit